MRKLVELVLLTIFYRYGYACMATPTPPVPTPTTAPPITTTCNDYLVPFSDANSPNNVPNFLDELNVNNPFIYGALSQYLVGSQMMDPDTRSLFFKRMLSNAQKSMDPADYEEIMNLKVPNWGNKSVRELLQCIPTETACDRIDVLTTIPDSVGISLWANCDPFAFQCSTAMFNALFLASTNGVFLQNTYTYTELRQYLQILTANPDIDQTVFRNIIINDWGGTVGDILDNAC